MNGKFKVGDLVTLASEKDRELYGEVRGLISKVIYRPESTWGSAYIVEWLDVDLYVDKYPRVVELPESTVWEYHIELVKNETR